MYGKDQPESEFLASCYRNSIQLAEGKKIATIAFPAISTGIFGYPTDLAVVVVFNTLLATLSEIENIKKIKFVLFSEEDLQLYQTKLKKISIG